MKNYNTMLHMKLNSAVSVFSIAAAFAVFLYFLSPLLSRSSSRLPMHLPVFVFCPTVWMKMLFRVILT